MNAIKSASSIIFATPIGWAMMAVGLIVTVQLAGA
ncbi:hypothetical protein EV666_11334 [Camelimonas lactis]|uniref:Uncharacterized protein n=1 Tax=Camelimonas lactis TaxID=659006 RepID=A0A4R2GQU8_9HYPH|nr:hypothetical protein EV666_11334 [Camelimonas lactis]